MKRINRRGGGAPLSFLLSFWPLLLVAGGLILLFTSGAFKGLFKGLRSIFDSFGDTASSTKDWFQYGGTGQAESIKEQIAKMQEGAKNKGVVVTPITKSKAMQVREAMNTYHPMSLSSMLNKDDAIVVRDLLINNTLEDQARIILAYGEQNLPQRLLIWNFLWDDTSGTLRDHVARYFPDGESKVQTLHYVDYAISTYLT